MKRIRKNGLPGSLDLLLDTMCNTFGGIMFIALALFVITQLAGKKISEMAGETTEALQKELADLERQCEELEKRKQSEWLEVQGIAPDGVSAILETLDAQAESEILAQAIEKATEELEEMQRQSEELLARSEDMAQDTRQTRVESKLRQEENASLEKRIQELSQKIAALEKELEAKRKPSETLVFSLERTMGSASEHEIYLINNRLYDDDSTSRKYLDLAKTRIRIYPSGSGVACTPESLTRYFQGLGGRFSFVHIWVGDNSFSSFLAVKRFLRKEKHPVSWTYTEDFEFFLRNDVTRDVSQ